MTSGLFSSWEGLGLGLFGTRASTDNRASTRLNTNQKSAIPKVRSGSNLSSLSTFPVELPFNRLKFNATYPQQHPQQHQVNPYIAVIQANEKIESLKGFLKLLRDSSQTTQSLVAAFERLKETHCEIYGNLCFQVWECLKGEGLNFGESKIKENPRILLVICDIQDGSNLIEQMIAHFVIKEKCERNCADLQLFAERLKSNHWTQQGLRLELQKLDHREILSPLYYVVWELDGKKPDPEYGFRKIVADPHILKSFHGRDLLVEIECHIKEKAKPRPAKNYLSKTLPKAGDSPRAAKVLRFELELERFLILLNDPQQNNEDLKVAFKKLDPKLQGYFSFYVWVACGKPEEWQFGENEIANDVRLLLQIQNGEKVNLVQQLLNHFHARVAAERKIAQAEAFYKRINDPVASPQQILQAFQQQDLIDIQGPLCQTVWEMHGKTGGLDYGLHTIQREPMILKSARMLEALKEIIDRIKKAERSRMKKSIAIYNARPKVMHKPGDTSLARLSSKFSVSSLPPKTPITFVTAEFAKAQIKGGGLAEAVTGMAEGLCERGHTVRVIMPKYDLLPDKFKREMQPVPELTIDDPVRQGKIWRVFRTTVDKLEYFFIEDTPQTGVTGQENLFELGVDANGNPGRIYGPDDATVRRRFTQFSSAAAELSYKLGGVVHVHDWHTSFIPELIARRHPLEWLEGQTPPTVFTFHNNNYAAQGAVYDNEPSLLQNMGLPLQYHGLNQNQRANALVSGLGKMDAGTTVSRTFAVECQTEHLGKDIHHKVRLAAHRNLLTGVVNGSSPSAFDPVNDLQLKHWKDPVTGEPIDLTYGGAGDDGAAILKKKKLIKEQLQKYFILHFGTDVCIDFEKPIVFYIGRYDFYQKGINMLDAAMESTILNGGQFICIGTDPDGEAKKIIERLQKRARELKGGAHFIVDEKRQDNRLKWQQGPIPTANDSTAPQGIGSLLRSLEFYIVPSEFEPCGLVQLEALQAGSIPICTRTGGLADTIITEGDEMNGFLFDRRPNWHGDPQQKMMLSVEIGKALRWWKSLSDVQRGAQMKKNRIQGQQSAWTSSRDKELPPIDQYQLIYAQAIHNAKNRMIPLDTHL